MCRFLDLSLMVCLSVSLFFVGVENTKELSRNLTYTWETPFTINLKWERPENLSEDCEVDYTINNCSALKSDSVLRIVPNNNNVKLNVSNENGLCFSVVPTPKKCGDQPEIQPYEISFPAPKVKLVDNIRCYYYSKKEMKCTWTPVNIFKHLKVFCWSDEYENKSLIECKQDLTKDNSCVIDNLEKHPKKLFNLFSADYQDRRENNTFTTKIEVQLNKPKLTIQRKELELQFITSDSHENEFWMSANCYIYQYNYSFCSETKNETRLNKDPLTVGYDRRCKYTASVQIVLSHNCPHKGGSPPSDKVEYGQNSYPELPVLLAAILIPLIVSCCLIVSLVLLRRNKEIIFPNIPDPSLLFKDMLNSNIRMTDTLWSGSVNRLYVPVEEIVESKIKLEPDTNTD